jgi:predicted phage terminase large subunit-like protein
MNLTEIVKKLDPAQQAAFMEAAEVYLNSKKRETAHIDFMAFVREMWPGFINGAHHKVMAKKFEEIASGKIKRLIINMPPRHTKSEFASYMLPAWFLGKFPNKKIIQCSNTAELAVGFGRKVRNLVGSEQYSKIFPDVNLRSDSKAAGRWSTNANGEYFAIGVGGTVTGKGADLLIIDDPHSEQEAAIASTNPEVYDKVYEWYSSGPRQRLQPGGSIIVVMCMVGETLVLMSDGTEKQLQNIRVGDVVATFDKGNLSTACVNNWQSNGFDSIYKIQTKSGKTLRANERHPFLVMNEGVLEWTRLKNLVVGDELVALNNTKDSHNHTIQGISDFTTDKIVSITADGKAEVFDVEIDRTENFIANGIVSHNTRWAKKDLTGRIIKSSVEKDGDVWETIDFPAILPSGRALWPEFWDIKELEVLKEELPISKWQAQYQQQPTSEEGALVKREWWKVWDKDYPPQCDFIIQSWDTAFTKNERSDYSACTTWGVFYKDENENDPNIILIDAYKARLEFPELKEKAFDMYKEFQPDAFIVEGKASGLPLIGELRRMGIPVSEFTPTRGNDKIARLNSVTDLFASGKVWAPEKRWAEEVIEEMASFPNSDHDDLVDSSTQALIRFRQGGFIRLPSDEPDEPQYFKSKRNAGYY